MPDLTPDIERELEAIDHALDGRRVAADLTELGELALLLREERPGAGRRLRPAARPARRARVPGAGPARPRVRAPLVRVARLDGARRSARPPSVLVVAVLVLGGTLGGDERRRGGASRVAAGGRRGRRGDGGRRRRGRAASGGAAAPSRPAAPRPRSSPARQATPERPARARRRLARHRRRDKRKVERSASITLAARPRDIDAVSAGSRTSPARRAASSSPRRSTRRGAAARGTFQLRIPTRNLDDAMAALARLAAVRERAQRSEDITAQAVSARSRLTDARPSARACSSSSPTPTRSQETESIRARLRLVSAEIEQARARASAA